METYALGINEHRDTEVEAALHREDHVVRGPRELAGLIRDVLAEVQGPDTSEAISERRNWRRSACMPSVQRATCRRKPRYVAWSRSPWPACGRRFSAESSHYRTLDS